MKKTLAMFCFLLINSPVYAAISEDAGRAAAPFLKVGIGARSVAVGESYVSIADDVDAINWNPAGLALVKYPQVSTTHIEYFQDINLESINYAQPLPDIGTFGLGFIMMYMPPISRTILNADQTDVIEVGEFTVRDMAVTLVLARSITNNLSMGGSLKIVQQKVDVQTNNGLLFDAGVMYRSRGRRMSLGATLQNFGEFEIDKSPIVFRVGGSYYLIPGKLLLAGGMNSFFDNWPIFTLGLEYNVASVLTLRVGYKYKSNADDKSILNEFTAGAGFRYENFWLDYAYAPFGVLGDSHRVSAKVGFGKPPVPRLIFRDFMAQTLESKKRVSSSLKDIDWEAGQLGILRGLPPEGTRLTYILIPDKKIIEPEGGLITPRIERIKPRDNINREQKDKIDNIQKNLEAVINDKESLELCKIANDYFLSGDYYESVDLYLKVLKIHPETYMIKYNIAGIYYSLRLYEEAVKWYERAALDNPYDSDIYFWLGFSYYKQKDIEKARNNWEKTIEIDPENMICKVNLNAINNKNISNQ